MVYLHYSNFPTILLQKLPARAAALRNVKFKKSSEVEKGRKVLKSDWMSSEENGMEGDDGALQVYSLPWRAACVSREHHRVTGR